MGAKLVIIVTDQKPWSLLKRGGIVRHCCATQTSLGDRVTPK
jgi:hypothetical protein